MRNTFSCCKTNITIFLRTFSSSPEINFRLEFVLIYFFFHTPTKCYLIECCLTLNLYIFFLHILCCECGEFKVYKMKHKPFSETIQKDKKKKLFIYSFNLFINPLGFTHFFITRDTDFFQNEHVTSFRFQFSFSSFYYLFKFFLSFSYFLK